MNRGAASISGAIGVGCPLQVVAQAAVRDHRGLRPARGAGRINKVGELVGDNLVHGIVGRRLRHRVHDLDIVQADFARSCHAISRAGLRQEDVEARVGRHVFKAFRWVRRIERDIGPSRLQHADERHHHLERPLEADADAGFRRYAQYAQVVGESVHAVVQVGESEDFVPEHDGRRQRRLGGLPLEQLHYRE